MAIVQHIVDAPAVVANATRYSAIGGFGGVSATETDIDVLMETAGTFSDLMCKVTTGNTSTITLRFRNAAIGTAPAGQGQQVVSVGASTSGTFYDRGNSDAVSAGGQNFVDLQWVLGSGSAPTVSQGGLLFSASSNTARRIIASLASGKSVSASGTVFYGLEGQLVSTATEAQAQYKCNNSATVNNSQVSVLTNAASKTTTIAFRKGGVSSLSISVTSASTGTFENTGGAATSVASTNLVNLLETIASGNSGAIVISSISVEWFSTDSSTIYPTDLTGTSAQGLSLTRFVGCIGAGTAANATESNVQNVSIQDVLSATRLQCEVSANTVSAASTLRFRKNTANGNQTASITASTTGIFQDTTNTDIVQNNDLICASIVTGGTGTSLTAASFGFTGVDGTKQSIVSDNNGSNWNDAVKTFFGGLNITEQLTMSDKLVFVDSNKAAFMKEADNLSMSDFTPIVNDVTELQVAFGCPHLNNWADAAVASTSTLCLQLYDAIGVVDGQATTNSGFGVMFGNGGTQEALGQSITPTRSGSVWELRFAALLPPTTTDTVTCNIYDALNGGTLIGTGTLSDTRFTLINAADIVFTFNCFLSAGVTYYVRLERTGARDTGSGYQFRLDSTAPYAGGSVLSKASGTWQTDPSNDLMFQLVAIGQSDASQVGIGLAVTDNNGANWNDVAVVTLVGNNALTLSVSDSNAANWADTLAIGYGLASNETITFSDSLGAQYGLAITDTNAANWSDVVAEALGILLVVADTNAANWNDSLAAGYGNAVVDTEVANWSDALAVGYGNSITDTDVANWSDRLTAGYGLATNETITFSDSLGAQYGLTVSDQMTLTDAVATRMDIALVVADTMSLSDSLVIGYGLASNETLTLSDSLGVQYGTVFSDTMSLSDAVVLTFGLNESASETITLTDSLRAGYGFSITDTETLADSTSLLEAMLLSVSDSLTMSDAVNAGTGVSLADSLTMSDQLQLGYGASTTDSLSFADAIQLQLGLIETVSDTLSMSDSLAVGYGDAFSETITFVDSNAIGYGDIISDNLNNWTDNVQINAGQALQTISVSDALSMSDTLGVGYGDVVSDSSTLSDSLALGYGAKVADSETLSDTLSVGYANSITDQLTQSDALSAGYGDLISDSFTLADALTLGFPNLQVAVTDTMSASDSLGLGVGNSSTDSLTLADSLGVGYGDQLTDSMSLTDAVTTNLSIAKAVSDTLSMSDALGIGYGDVITESMTQVDTTGAGYGLVISEQMTLADNVTISQSSTILTVQASDSMSQTDSLGAGYGMAETDVIAMTDSILQIVGMNKALSDQMSLTDAVRALVEMRLAAGDDLNLWQELVGKLYAMLWSVQESGTMSDSLAAEFDYLLYLTDANAGWFDAAFAGTVNELLLAVADTGELEWLDSVLYQLSILFAASRVRGGVGIQYQFEVGGVSVTGDDSASVGVEYQYQIGSVSVTPAVRPAGVSADYDISFEVIV